MMKNYLYFWFIHNLSYITLNKLECTILLRHNYLPADTDRRNFVQQFQDVVGNSDALSSDTEEETLQERNSFILSQVMYHVL